MIMLHKTALVILALFINTILYCQFNKGDRMAGASLGSAFFSSGNSDQTVTSIGSRTVKVNGYGVIIMPSLAWFVSENTAAGGSLYINPSGDKNSFESNGSTFQRDKSRYFNIGVGAFVRNYFAKGGAVLPFGQFNLDGGISMINKDGFFYGGSGLTAYKKTYDTKSSGGSFIDAILTLGCTKMFGKNTGLDLSIGYNFSYTKNTITTVELRDNLIDGTIDETGKSETTSKFTNHKFILGLGFQVFLDRNKK